MLSHCYVAAFTAVVFLDMGLWRPGEAHIRPKIRGPVTAQIRGLLWAGEAQIRGPSRPRYGEMPIYDLYNRP